MTSEILAVTLIMKSIDAKTIGTRSNYILTDVEVSSSNFKQLSKQATLLSLPPVATEIEIDRNRKTAKVMMSASQKFQFPILKFGKIRSRYVICIWCIIWTSCALSHPGNKNLCTCNWPTRYKKFTF